MASRVWSLSPAQKFDDICQSDCARCYALITYAPKTSQYVQIIVMDEWEKLKSAGAVFLPAAGHRNASGLYDVGSTGYYWHSSPREDAADYAYLLYFKGFSLYDSHILKRELGHCVRLVTE